MIEVWNHSRRRTRRQMSSERQEFAGRAQLQLARSYAQSAEALRAAGLAGKPFWHLVGQALELSLKAALFACGVPPVVIFRLNHDLGSALQFLDRTCRDQCMIGSLAVRLIDQLDLAYGRGDFRYPSLLQEQPLPDTADAASQLELQIRAISQFLDRTIGWETELPSRNPIASEIRSTE